MKNLRFLTIVLYFIAPLAFGQPQKIIVGSSPNNEDGDNPHDAWTKQNANNSYQASPALIYHSFINGSYIWPTNWVSDSGHQMYILANSLAPLVVSNNVLGAPTGTLFSVGNDFGYISVSNAQPFDVIGMNIETDDVLGGTTAHSWQALFLLSPNPIFPQSGLDLSHTNNFLHVTITLGDTDGVGVLFATNFLSGPYSYSNNNLPDPLKNVMGRGSRHNIEMRRLKPDSASVAIDGITLLEFVNTNLPLWWGTNLVWEFAAAFAPEDQDSTRTRVSSVYTRRLAHSEPESLTPGPVTNFNTSFTFTLPFPVVINTPTTNTIGINGVFLTVGFPTNNTFANGGYPNGSIVTTTNGQMFVRSNGVWMQH